MIAGHAVDLGPTLAQRLGEQFAAAVAAQDEDALVRYAICLKRRQFEHAFRVETRARRNHVFNAVDGELRGCTRPDRSRQQAGRPDTVFADVRQAVVDGVRTDEDRDGVVVKVRDRYVERR